MTEKITELPQELVDQFPAIREEWIRYGLCTDKADRPRAERGVDLAYEAVGLTAPKTKLWFDSPIQGSIVASILAAADTLEAAMPAIEACKKHNFDMKKVRKTGVDLPESFSSYGSLHGQYEVGWLSFYSVFKGLIPEVDKLEGLFEIAKSCGWWWSFDEVAVMTERPNTIKLDGERRLHNEHGPSVSYPDGWALYHYHGVDIPSEWITEGLPSAAQALQWENVEQRRAACEMIGWISLLDQLDAVVIDKDTDPEIGELVEVTLPNGDESPTREKFLKVLCGTGREFALPVPPEMTTALEAQSWTWGMDPNSFIQPEIRT